jgi:exopolyphosphatase / guanosine-5'-triphosphate,3'-diphosphate pyrophosphatase
MLWDDVVMSALADPGAGPVPVVPVDTAGSAPAIEPAQRRSELPRSDAPGTVPVRKSRNRDAWTGRAGAMRRGHTYGALDLGTNNCRLLIARPGPQGFTIVDAYSRVVRLGEGLMEAGRLSDAAMDRTVAALAACADKLARRDVRLTRNVATEACRRASNGVRFVERVYAETGIALDVISAAEEARLAVLGCHMLIAPDGPPALVFDIGGGSTEVMLVNARGSEANDGVPEILDWISLPWGVVSLAETEPQWTGAADREAGYARMIARVSHGLDGFAARLAARGVGDVQLLGTAGTITTLASVEMGLPAYDRRIVDGSMVDASSLVGLCRSIAVRSAVDRARIPCIGHDRAELIVAGCAIVDAILSRWPGDGVRVADRGIREGILRTLMMRDGVWASGQ